MVPPIDGGEATLEVYATLNLFEWWNHPATEPLRQPNQRQFVTSLSVSGPIKLLEGWESKSQDFSEPYSVHYNMFRIPRGGVAVFEVVLELQYFDVGNGFIESDFADPYFNGKVLCPYVDLEIGSLG
jgi:hypothetical protein